MRSVQVRRHRSPRGVAVIVTVLLIAIAASIAFAIARQSLLSARTTADRIAASQAEDAARQSLVRLSGTLEAQPMLFTTRVLDGEPDRRCLTGPNADTLYSAGDVWPADCGVVWSYDPPDEDWTGVRLELFPPTPDDPALSAAARVVINRSEVVLVGRYLPLGANRFTWFGTGTLDLATAGASQQANISGAVYSTTVTGTDTPAVGLDGAVGGETLVPTQPAAVAGVTWLSATPNPDGTPPVGDIRQRIRTASSSSMIVNSLGVIDDIGCRASDGAANTNKGVASLCLEPGDTVTDADGDTVEVPTGGKVLVVPDGNRLRIWHHSASTDFTPASNLLCVGLPNCSLVNHLATLANDGQHPAAVNYWEANGGSFLGEFRFPASGVLKSSAPVHIGVCRQAPNGPYSFNTACDTAEFTRSLSIAAPTIVVGSPITTTGRAQVALVSGTAGETQPGNIVLPYWSRLPGNDAFPLEAHLLVPPYLGSGMSGFPAENVGVPNTTPSVTITGSVNGVAGTAGIAGFTTVNITPPQTSSNSAPPWFSPAGVAWGPVIITRTEPAPTILVTDN